MTSAGEFFSEANGKRSIAVPGFTGLVGYARRDVTGPVGIRNRNWGAATSDLATGAHRPLEVSVLAFANSDRSSMLVLATWDNCTWKRSDEWRPFQDQVLDALGLRPDQFVINLSHTHAGVHTCRASANLPGGAGLPAYMDFVTAAVIEAGREAIAELKPAIIEWTSGHCEVAANRDLYREGIALTGWNPEDVADPTVLIGRVTRPDGSSAITVVNYACHGTTLGPENMLLSPDYVGALRETVESATNAPCVFLQGSSGDTAPREQYGSDIEVADRHGRALGYAVLAALNTIPAPGTDLELVGAVQSGAPLAHWSARPAERSSVLRTATATMDLHLRELPTLEQLQAEWAEIPVQSRDERVRRVQNLRDGYIDLEYRPGSVDHGLWAAQIGDALLVAHHGESYNWFQVDLRRRFPGRPLLVLGNSNGGGHVYLPDARAYARNAYQAWQTVLAEGALESLADGAEQLLRSIGPDADHQ